jgi:hypothetical protein
LPAFNTAACEKINADKHLCADVTADADAYGKAW